MRKGHSSLLTETREVKRVANREAFIVDQKDLGFSATCWMRAVFTMVYEYFYLMSGQLLTVVHRCL